MIPWVSFILTMTYIAKSYIINLATQTICETNRDLPTKLAPFISDDKYPKVNKDKFLISHPSFLQSLCNQNTMSGTSFIAISLISRSCNWYIFIHINRKAFLWALYQAVGDFISRKWHCIYLLNRQKSKYTISVVIILFISSVFFNLD